jgi:FixJ family two-component response regulator
VSGGLHITLVEDSPELCESWVDLLTIEGYEVRAFLSAREFLDAEGAIQATDVLVSDYYLPDLNGFELAQRVRAVRSELPVVLLTGNKDPKLRKSVEALGQTRFLTKPLRYEDLMSALASLVPPKAADASASGRLAGSGDV